MGGGEDAAIFDQGVLEFGECLLYGGIGLFLSLAAECVIGMCKGDLWSEGPNGHRQLENVTRHHHHILYTPSIEFPV